MVLLWAGGLLLLAALLLTLRNLGEENQAARQAEDSLQQIIAQLPEPSQEEAGSAGPLIPEMVPEEDTPADAAELPTVTVNGAEYIGTLSLPALGLTLPILRDWSDQLLKLAPCRYQGSVQTGDIAGGPQLPPALRAAEKPVPRGQRDLYRCERNRL